MYIVHADQMKEGEKIGERKKSKEKEKVDEIGMSGVGGLWALVSFSFFYREMFCRLVDGLMG